MRNSSPPEKHDSRHYVFRFFCISHGTKKFKWVFFAFLFTAFIFTRTGEVQAQRYETAHYSCNYFAATQSSTPTIDLANTFAPNARVTPWIDVTAHHGCRIYITPNYPKGWDGWASRLIYYGGRYQILPSPISRPMSINNFEGASYAMHIHESFPWFAVIARVKNGSGAWVPINNNYNSNIDIGNSIIRYYSMDEGWSGPYVTDTGIVQKNVQFQFAVLRYGNDQIPARLNQMDIELLKSRLLMTGAYYVTIRQNSGDTSQNEYVESITDLRGIRFRVNFQAVSATCPTPAVSGGNTRTLDPVRWDDLPSVGSAAKHQDLNLQFNNCSSYLSKIRYRIDANGTSPNLGQGLLPLIAPSTASGIAV